MHFVEDSDLGGGLAINCGTGRDPVRLGGGGALRERADGSSPTQVVLPDLGSRERQSKCMR